MIASSWATPGVTAETLDSALNALQQAGVSPAVVVPGAIAVWGAEADVVRARSLPFVRAALNSRADVARPIVTRELPPWVVRAFDAIKSGATMRHGDISIPTHGSDVLLNSDISNVLEDDELEEEPDPFTASVVIRSCRYTNCYFSGRVAVAMFFVESTSPENVYSWTTTDIENTKIHTFAAFSYLSNRAQTYGAAVTFVPEYYQPLATAGQASHAAVFVPYEPILRPARTPELTAVWIDPIMANLGFSAVKYFNSNLRSRKAADRAYSAFFTYAPPNVYNYSDGIQAWALLGGPYLQMPLRYEGAAQFDWIFAHETTHEFWACDEYVGDYCKESTGCNSCYLFGYGPRPDSPNGNCEATSCSTHGASCLMRYRTETNFCTFTARQVGWID